MKIIIGLGNPGEKYQKTRHNVGFEILDILAEELSLNWQEDKKKKALIARDTNFLLVKPMSFMNLSGEPTKAILSYYNILPKNFKIFTAENSDLSENLFVIHDDLDIDLGKYKESQNSRSAGHNGVQSIINHLKTKNFNRFRVGVRNENLKHIPAEKFVLQRFSKEERELILPIYKEIVDKLKK